MSTKTQIIAANFETKDGAKDALKAVKHAKVSHGTVAILSKSDKGKVKVKETDEWGAFAGAFAGAAAGSILVGGILGLGIYAFSAAAIGGVIGGVIADKTDTGLPNDQLKEMAESLEPDHSMYVMLTDADSVQAVEGILSEVGGQLISHPISAELMDELGKAVAAAEAESKED